MAYPPRGHSLLLPVLLVITPKPWLLLRPCTHTESRSRRQAQLLNAYLLRRTESTSSASARGGEHIQAPAPTTTSGTKPQGEPRNTERWVCNVRASPKKWRCYPPRTACSRSSHRPPAYRGGFVPAGCSPASALGNSSARTLNSAPEIPQGREIAPGSAWEAFAVSAGFSLFSQPSHLKPFFPNL